MVQVSARPSPREGAEGLTVYVVRFRAVRVVTNVLAPTNLDDMGVGVKSFFDLTNSRSAPHIFALSNIIVFIAATWTVLLTSVRAGGA